MEDDFWKSMELSDYPKRVNKLYLKTNKSERECTSCYIGNKIIIP